MKKIIYIIASLLVPQLLLSQQISFNKDSLSITCDLPHGYTGWVEYYYLDSLSIINVGNEVLTIDSIKTEESYLYKLKIIHKDSVEYSSLYNDWRITPLNILPNDSLKIIFADPDFCPICKTNSVQESFSDKFYFYSNSKNDDIYKVEVQGEGFSTAVENDNPPLDFRLYQNYPNPFNPTTKIRLSIKGDHRVRMILTNILGEFVKELINERYYEGDYEVELNGEKLSSGVYYYSLILDNQAWTKKMLLIK